MKRKKPFPYKMCRQDGPKSKEKKVTYEKERWSRDFKIYVVERGGEGIVVQSEGGMAKIFPTKDKAEKYLQKNGWKKA